jgi:hypothetical protein
LSGMRVRLRGQPEVPRAKKIKTGKLQFTTWLVQQ